MVGALTALEDHLGVDVRSFDEMVGTSAGSVLSSLLASGVSVAELRTHQMEGSLTYGKLAGFEWNYDESTGGDRPPAPRAGFGSTVLLRKPIRELRQLPPMAVLAALLPEGRGRLDSVGALVRHVVGDGWVERSGLTLAALDYDLGVRVPFGRAGAPAAGAAEAVMASCAIPGWYQPVTINERRYIDGGTWSSTNIDLMAGLGLDEVHVLAPQASFDLDAPRELVTRLERQWRTPGDRQGAAGAGRGPLRGDRRDDHRSWPRGPRGDRWQPHGRRPAASRDGDVAADLAARPGGPRSGAPAAQTSTR